MKSTTKLSRFLIDHRWSTVILRRWIGIDRRYRPYSSSSVGEPLSTVDINCEQSTGSINRWIGIDIYIAVGTISHHPWDQDFFVDVCPGPFLITDGTIWDHRSMVLFPLTSQKKSSDFFLVWIHIDGRFRPIFGWNRRSMRYRPYFQVCESLSTIDIDHILK